MRRISKDITKRNEMACSSCELHAICFLCPLFAMSLLYCCLFPPVGCFVPMLGMLCSHLGNVMFPVWECYVPSVGIMLRMGGDFDSP